MQQVLQKKKILGNTSFQDLVYHFHETVRPLDVKLIYEGEINHNIMKLFTSLAEKSLSEENFPGQRKVFNVMVEALQNISKHAECVEGNNKKNKGKGIFLISNNKAALTIVTGNVVKKEKEVVLTEKLNYINTLTKEELKVHYKEKLKASKLSDKGGAGLGFIDIAKKTKNKLDFGFYSIDKNHSFFIMSAKISK